MNRPSTLATDRAAGAGEFIVSGEPALANSIVSKWNQSGTGKLPGEDFNESRERSARAAASFGKQSTEYSAFGVSLLQVLQIPQLKGT